MEQKMPTANSTFKLKSWDEKPYNDNPKLVRAAVAKSFEGDLTGESTLEYLMVYTSERQASFVGLERFEGTLAGKKGAFVMQRTGTAGADSVVREEFFIVPGSGTGELKTLTGKGKWDSGHAESYPFSFEYEL
jgi:hypothetical protein